LAEAEAKAAKLRYAADLLVAVEFRGGNARQKEDWQTDAAIQASYYVENQQIQKFGEVAKKSLNGQATFHWPLEFPEVFVERGGFDAVVGNPPFLWGNRISSRLGNIYRDWLLFLHPGTLGNADLCVHFFRRGHNLIRSNGLLGLVATNSIRETDNRVSGLETILSSSCTIIRATPDCPWPGSAVLRIAQVHLFKGKFQGACYLNNKLADQISAFLDDSSVENRLHHLPSQTGISYKGVDTGGLGFIVTADELEQIKKSEPESLNLIWPFLNGQEFMSHPEQLASRLIINFSEMSLPQASRHRILMELVKSRVLPYRQTVNRKANRERWWLYNEPRPGLYSAISGLQRVLINCVVSKYVCFEFVSPRTVFANTLNIFAVSSCSFYAVSQSSIHEAWARYYGSTLRTDLRYNPTDCFETFPFPSEIISLEIIGLLYHTHRRSIMLARQEGLTKTYNRFHDPEEKSTDIRHLRELHQEMDEAVAQAYGWSDLRLEHGFRETKHGVRFTISEAVRRKVLNRLLELNHQRYADEVVAGLHEKGANKKASPKKRGKGKSGIREAVPGGIKKQPELFVTSDQTDLFEE
jgi:Eco57I restriction-modification methylase/restriction-modification enzyme MmeI-like protein